jgi:hypothetical protein
MAWWAAVSISASHLSQSSHLNSKSESTWWRYGKKISVAYFPSEIASHQSTKCQYWQCVRYAQAFSRTTASKKNFSERMEKQGSVTSIGRRFLLFRTRTSMNLQLRGDVLIGSDDSQHDKVCYSRIILLYLKVYLCVPTRCIMKVVRKSPVEFKVSYAFSGDIISAKFQCETEEESAAWMGTLRSVRSSTEHRGVVKDGIHASGRSLYVTKTEVFQQLPPVMNLNNSYIAISPIVAVLRARIRLRLLEALYALQTNVTSRVQSEALTAAESLAEMNEELLAKIDRVPLQIGIGSLKSAIEKNDFKLKLRALNSLRMS